MASIDRRRPENVDGAFFVDETCIDCDHCRWIAPAMFHRAGKQSAVHHQPANATEEVNAMQALFTCPTGSIGTTRKTPASQAARKALPLLIEDNVYYSGYSARHTAACTSYFIRHPDGNVLIDSPRFVSSLVQQIEEMGGIRWMYLTHIDHVGDHKKFRTRFGCERIIHADEKNPQAWWDYTAGWGPPEAELDDVEHQLTGYQPVELLPQLWIIPVPGHTRGNTVMLYRNRYLFSGDHLFHSPTLGHLAADRLHNWWSWPKQIESMRQLKDYEFEWVLPGHQGGGYHAPAASIRTQMDQCIEWMEAIPPGQYVAPHPSFGGPETRFLPVRGH